MYAIICEKRKKSINIDFIIFLNFRKWTVLYALFIFGFWGDWPDLTRVVYTISSFDCLKNSFLSQIFLMFINFLWFYFFRTVNHIYTFQSYFIIYKILYVRCSKIRIVFLEIILFFRNLLEKYFNILHL